MNIVRCIYNLLMPWYYLIPMYKTRRIESVEYEMFSQSAPTRSLDRTMDKHVPGNDNTF